MGLENVTSKRVCIVDSSYSFFLYVLLFDKEIENTTFIVSSGIPDKVVNNIPNKIVIPAFGKSIFSTLFRLIYVLHFKFFRLKKIRPNKKSQVYGQDHLFYSFPFMRDGISLIEDGMANYHHPKKSFSSKLRSLLSGGDEWGYSDKVEKIYLTGMYPIPEKLASKIELIDIKKIWQEKSLNQQKKITDLFSFTLEHSSSEKDVVILTQPFSEDGAITEIEKIEIYKNIAKNYEDSNIVIKPHPREITQYEVYFKCKVLNNHYPFQLFLLNQNPSKIVSCFSSFPSKLEGVSVEMYGTGMSEKLKSFYGDIKGNVCG